MLNILLLEDDLKRVDKFRSTVGQRHNLVWVETADKAIRAMSQRRFDAIFLDHDLGGEVYVDTSNKNTGSEVVRWMIDHDHLEKIGQPDIVIHSMNYPASAAMERDLREYFRYVNRIPYCQLASNYMDDPSFLPAQ